MDDPRRHDRHDDELEALTVQDLFQLVRRGVSLMTVPSLYPCAYDGSPVTMSRR